MQKNIIERTVKVTTDSPVSKILRPVNNFLHTEASSGIILLLMAIIAIVWANSPYYESYFTIWNQQISVDYQGFKIELPLVLWINDLLMAIFFFVVGLEIKREIIVGELSSLKKASLPIIAAAGGMIIPAIVYLSINGGTPGERGWGIPVATDIAFSIGILSLLGKRVPITLKVFLTAFAIADDIGAVLVIAIFYTSKISTLAIVATVVIVLLLMLVNVLKIMRPFIYVSLGIFLWIAVFASGIHATIAGILLAFTIPAKARINAQQLLQKTKKALHEIDKGDYDDKHVPVTTEFLDSIREMEAACENVTPPLHRIEYKLHPYVAYLIMPLFALANSGVRISGDFISTLFHPISLGIILGLFFGKQIGIFLFSYFAVKLKLALFPQGSSYKQIYGVACIGGIGFTMSLFVASLAFTDPVLIDFAKVGILTGSLLSGITGYIILKYASDENIKKKSKK